jgi:hypothetical protein
VGWGIDEVFDDRVFFQLVGAVDEILPKQVFGE